MATQETKTLEYIFPRTSMQDPFDSSLWTTGEARKLTVAHADRLLKHPDCWAVTTKKAKFHPPQTQVLDEEEREKEEEDIDTEMDMPNLEGMTKAQIARFAKSQFNFDLDEGKMNKPEMQEKVRTLLASRRH